jgi:hypothetical protein
MKNDKEKLSVIVIGLDHGYAIRIQTICTKRESTE